MRRIFKECDYGDRSEDALQLTYDFYFKGVHPKDNEKNIEQIVKVLVFRKLSQITFLPVNR